MVASDWVGAGALNKDERKFYVFLRVNYLNEENNARCEETATYFSLEIT